MQSLQRLVYPGGFAHIVTSNVLQNDTVIVMDKKQFLLQQTANGPHVGPHVHSRKFLLETKQTG